MTEAGMITSNPYDGERIPGTVGYPLPGVEARIARRSARNPRAQPVQGLLAQPRKDRGGHAPRRLVRHRRHRDEAADGRVTIVGRAKDLIIAGGLNIYPQARSSWRSTRCPASAKAR